MQPTTITEIDDALTECAIRIRRAREHHDREAAIVYRAQANRLLDWRADLMCGGSREATTEVTA